MIIDICIPPPCRQNICTFTGPYNLKANTIGYAAVENEGQWVENYRLSGGDPEQFQLFKHLCDLIYKWANLGGELARNLLELRNDCIHPVICIA